MTNVTFDTTAPPPPTAAPQPTTQDLIAEYWNAVHYSEFWSEKVKALKLQLADRLCLTEEGYKNKTLDLGPMRLELAVKRELKIAMDDPNFLTWFRAAPPDQKNLILKTVPASLKPSLSGYNALPKEAKTAIASAITVTESVGVKFVEKKDER